ncbi:MAG TPA: tRNA (adenosine(37)-N6)-threonylcarbamoyltransferase complex ATPase subunit type 1 TsaE [Magnetospirillaceae bacterium]|nr:tRNA (adenosine(37)-N6)-threonylcarbamoyltransferase complex ATPase subunit type 1 TsaE [Magnetospirillaceae bacterium]
MKVVRTCSPEETRALGERVGRLASPGTVIALRGGLGMGKTTFAKGIAAGLGVEDEVTSPTYTLVFEYPGRIPLRHVDAYRLRSGQEFEDIGGRELMSPDGICIIEWSENVSDALPGDASVLEIRPGDGPDERVFEIRGAALEDLLP